MNFAKTSLSSRLLAGSSRLVVLGRLGEEDLDALSSHWVFLMQRTLIVVPERIKDRERWQVYTSLPFSPSGRQLNNAATWSLSKGLVVHNNTLLPDKFSDFFGASVNVTALPYKPYWTKDERPDGGVLYWGADRRMLESLASALNFSIYVMPVESWEESPPGWVFEARGLRTSWEEDLDALSSHWVFLMQRTLIVVPERIKDRERWQVYTSLPFSPSGRQLNNAATWSLSKGLVVHNNTLLPDKFSDFFGASVNVTALPYKPYWTKDERPDGGVLYWGADRRMLESLASALNFSIYVMPVESWEEVLQRVSDRTSMVASVVHMVLPQRLLRVDFTRTYEHGINIAFSMAKPVLKPQWQSLYYPLESIVWCASLGVLVITPNILILLYSLETPLEIYMVIEIVGTLLGQALNPRLPTIASGRILLATWLLFSFIVGTAYRSNLMASLIAPRYPPRPEALEELVKVAKRVTMPSYGAEFRDYLKASEFESFRSLGAMLDVGVSVTEGLNQALKSRQSHIDGTRYLEQQIAEHFTEANGDSRLYVGRQGVLPGLNAWPIPHDAPYKENFDAVILAVIEGGLYNKWMKDMLDQARKEGRQRRREKIQQMLSEQKTVEEESVDTGSSNEARALTIVHLQGPLMIMVLGAVGAFVVFVFEVMSKRFSPVKETGFGVAYLSKRLN
ncbi:LOW QUALITY PROTEIN: ionotropic receptor 93a-like [Palaemon carinicauda]|uniref:LOW QUALITY PROTEIN: ionotropic receptor 93a-like n=1 Tax=Palaemon carinicauda TaxID=392227 RepID=UPI0035B5D59E